MNTRNRMLAEMGIRPVWRLRESPAAVEVPGAEPGATEAVAVTHPAHEPDQALAVARMPDAGQAWSALEARIHACRACVLCEARKQAVPGVGDRQADWMFVGEGPGAEEDARGEPFVGQAGKLLDAMLAACGLSRDRGVYIANAVKCRPPNNRTPEADEIAACKPFLDEQIALVQPRLLIALGRPAAQALLGQEMSIAGARGKLHRYGELQVVVTYHPAYLLRNLPDKARAWEDLCFAMETMERLRG